MTGLAFKPLHPTFGAEVIGADFTNPSVDLVDNLKKASAKYGVLVCRSTGLNDDTHVAMSRVFGESDDVKPYSQLGRKHRLKYEESFDVSNIDAEGNILQPGTQRYILGKGNQVFHVDSSFNPRRCGTSSSSAHESPPRGMGGNTEFADSRTAYEDLDDETKDKIKDWVLWHSQHHSRRVASPGEPSLEEKRFLPESHPFGKHKSVQTHEPSGRTNMYIANHAYKVDHLPLEEGQEEIRKLIAHASQPQYVLVVEWENPGDLVIWDNTAVMHRACPGEFEGKYRRDMRRTTVHDSSSYAWGLNKVGDTWRSGSP